MAAPCQGLYNILEFLLAGSGKINGDPKAGSQGKLFLHSIHPVKLITIFLLVGKLLPHQMPSVGGSVNQHIVRPSLQPAFYHRL